MEEVKITPYEKYENPGSISVRLHSIDVGFSLLGEKLAVIIPPETCSASYESPSGERLVVEGDREGIVRTLRTAGDVIF